eukprot:1249524-Prymnesium_polylepis.1
MARSPEPMKMKYASSSSLAAHSSCAAELQGSSRPIQTSRPRQRKGNWARQAAQLHPNRTPLA